MNSLYSFISFEFIITSDWLNKIEIVDTKAPTIKINGSRVVNVEVYSDYTELGATMTDDYDEDNSNLQPSYITYTKLNESTASKVDHVDTSKLGLYKLFYEYTDKAGNHSVNALNKNSKFVVREVHVRDTQAPQIRLNGKLNNYLEYMEDNYVEEGATVTDNYDEGISNLQPSLITYSKLNENGDYVKVGNVDSVDTTKEGLYKLFYNYTDTSGNKSVNAYNTSSNFVTRYVYVRDTKVTITFTANGLSETKTFTKGNVVAPLVNPYTVNGITYSFKNWNVADLQSIVDDTTVSAIYEVSSIKTKSGIELVKDNETLLNTIKDNTAVTLTDNIKTYAKNQADLDIVVDNDLNYKVYTSLVYNPEDGFEYTTETRTVIKEPVEIDITRLLVAVGKARLYINSINKEISNPKYYVGNSDSEREISIGDKLEYMDYVKVTYTDNATKTKLDD